MSVVKIRNADWATRLLAQTTLRNILGAHKLSELLESRDSIQRQLREQLDEGTDPWGVKVETVAIKDVRIPHELQRSMAAEAEANREAKAKVCSLIIFRVCVAYLYSPFSLCNSYWYICLLSFACVCTSPHTLHSLTHHTHTQVITATGELNAARALKEAAESIASSSTAMQLRYLQTLNIIAAERGSTIIFPIPIDMMGPMVTIHTHTVHVLAAVLTLLF